MLRKVLKSQLFGKIVVLCAALCREQWKGAEGITVVVNSVYQQESLSVTSETFHGFNASLTTRGGSNGSLKNFEIVFLLH